MRVLLYLWQLPQIIKNYYKRWPENWADKLGGVNR